MSSFFGLRRFAGRATSRLAALLALVALMAIGGAGLSSPSGAQQPSVPEGLELTLSLVDDSDNVVQAGSTITVRGQVRLTGSPATLSVSAGDLRLSAHQSWETTDRPSLNLPADQQLFRGQELSDAIPSIAPSAALPNGSAMQLLAYDGDTIAARAFDRDATRIGNQFDENPIYLFKASTGEQVARLRDYRRISNGRSCTFRYSEASCTTGNNHRWSWGRANDDNTGSAVAVWQQDDDTAWLFVGWPRSDYENSGGFIRGHMGALVIYEIDYSADPVTATRRHTITVPLSDQMPELRSRGNPGNDAGSHYDLGYYGVSVAISADGSTLAVGARRMHEVGAVYVYTRPASGWRASFGWNDGVRVSPVVIPPWGNAANRRPFEPESTTDGDGATECDAYCRSVSSFVGDVDDSGTDGHAEFGYYLALSADGSVLAVSAPEKRFSSTRTAGPGRFRGARNLPRHGEVFVFTAPAGGWSATPNYKTETTPDRTEIAYNADASSFSQASHYNTGPDKRVQAPAWSFSFDWSTTQNYYLGERLALSPDGTTLAASDRRNNAVNIFQVSSPSGWASGPTTPSAQITGVDDGGRWGGFGFSRDGQTFALGDPTWTTNQGRVLFFERPADGSWADATDDDAEEVLAPTATYRRAQERWGRALAWNLNRNVLAVSATEGPQPSSATSTDNVGPGRIWTLTSPLTCPVTERTDADGTTRTSVCTVDLGDARVVIPKGTPDGPLTISGSVTLVYGMDADGEPLSVRRTAALTLQIGDVQEVEHVRLGFATDDQGTPNDVTDDRPHPSALSLSGSSTVLRLQILNELEKAAATGSVASAIVTATFGTLSTEFGGGCATGSGGTTCRLDISALNSGNADNIPITLTHPGREGTAQVSALVIAADGMSRESEPLAVVLAGRPTSLSVEEVSGALKTTTTPDNSGPTLDNSDVLEIFVTARDRLDQVVPAPTQAASYRLTGPDGKRVPSDKIAVQWPLTSAHCSTSGIFPAFPVTVGGWGVIPNPEEQQASEFSANQEGRPLCVALPGRERYRAYDAQGDDFLVAVNVITVVIRGQELATRELALGDLRAKARLNVNAAADEPLASGEYTLELRARGLSATATFRLAGPPAAITLSAPETRPAPNERFTLSATIVDADGNAVPDGTPVEWSTVAPTGGATLVRLDADLVAKGGEASSAWLAANAGSAFVRVTAGEQQQLHAFNVTVPPATLVGQMSRGAEPGFGVWLGSQGIRASALVAGVEGVDAIHILRSQPTRWLTYAVDNGILRSGSGDFLIRPGDIYWVE